MAYNSEKTKANREYYLRNGRCPRCGGANPVEPGRHRCRECALKSSNARREQRIKRREDRRCTRCGKTLPEDSRYIQCNECRTYLRKYQVFNKARYEQLKAEGKCVKCGEWAAPGKTMCRKCLDNHIANGHSRGDRYKEQKRARRDAYRSVGRCIDCGRPVDEGHTRCKRCRDLRMDSTRKYRIMKKIKQGGAE